MMNEDPEDELDNVCLTPKPPLPPGASPQAYWECNKTTKEWDYHDPWLALMFGEGYKMSTKDGITLIITKVA